MKFVFLCFAITVFLASCATVSQLPEATLRVPLEPVRVALGIEVYGLRVDLYRMRGSDNPLTNNSNNLVPSAPKSDPSNYAVIGIDIGSSLFYDDNGNLAVDLVRLYGLHEPFLIQELTTGLMPYTVTYERQGDWFKRSGGGTMADVKIHFNDIGCDLNYSGASTSVSIYNEKDQLTYDSHGLLGSGKSVLRQSSPSHIETPGVVLGQDFVAKSDDEVALGNRFTISRKDNTLQVVQSSFIAGMIPEIKFVRTASGCFFSDQSGNSFSIQRVSDTITVLKNNNLYKTYKILPNK